MRGTSQRRLLAMLYAGPTGAARPAPATEYVLVAVVQEQGSAWVEVHAGIDINPAALTLPAVPWPAERSAHEPAGGQPPKPSSMRLGPGCRSPAAPRVTIALLVIGVVVYMAVTPFRERALLVHGNAAAGVVLGGAVLALAMPLAVLLATSFTLLDIAVWGVVALVLQLLTARRRRGLAARPARHDRAGNLAAAVALAATQIAVALLNAAAMVPS